MKYITIRPIKGWFSNKINIDKIISNIPNKIIIPAIYSKRKGKSTCKINKVIPPASKIIPASNDKKKIEEKNALERNNANIRILKMKDNIDKDIKNYEDKLRRDYKNE